MRQVVEEIVASGKRFNIGLEAGSKPELHAVLAINTESNSLIICNGYKDESYLELALLAKKMGQAGVYRGGEVERAFAHHRDS